MTQNLTAVGVGNIAADANPAQAGTAGQIAAAVEAVRDTMETIGTLKEAEGLSDTVVDAIEILENAWEELREVRLGGADNGNGTRLDAITNTQITGVTQEQVDTLREALSNFI